ncbi:transporter substrate-binding domain-containing protein [Aestuariirhabdus litorea]|uniref:transporter substrate-binding domain-containing protein n=1 Tax=Aestuariirhabdus litorea TaxID=2528527 RepID=UPI0013E304C6|nr:transporter substrate-binding domain-containing protein [Aestuariirhabdus litorea]
MVLLLPVPGQADEPLRCGVATGFPPFQYVLDGQPAGLDVAVIHALARELNHPVEIVQRPWEEVLRLLRKGEIECVAGMEVTEERSRYSRFTVPYYSRQAVIFVRADNAKVIDERSLEWSMVSGDHDSEIERRIQSSTGDGSHPRFFPVASKRDAMELLQRGLVEASIMPREVGFYLAAELGLKVRVVGRPGKASPVVIGVARDLPQLHLSIERGLVSLIERGEIKRLSKEAFLR